MSNKNSIQKWCYLAILSLVWGSSFILIKKGLTGFNYIEAATIRLMAAGLVFCPWGFYLLRSIPLQKLGFIFFASLLGVFVPSYLFCISQLHIASSVAGMLNALTPLFTFLVSIFMFKKTFSSLQVVGLVVGFVASSLLMLKTSDTEFSLNFYAFFIVLATIGYGFHINFIKHYLSDVPPLSIASVSVTMAGLLAFCFFYLPNHEKYYVNDQNATAIVCLIILGVAGTAFAQYLHAKLIAVSSSLFASTSTYIIPIVAVFWGLYDGEQLTVIHLISIIGVLLAVVLIRQDKAVKK